MCRTDRQKEGRGRPQHEHKRTHSTDRRTTQKHNASGSNYIMGRGRIITDCHRQSGVSPSNDENPKEIKTKLKFTRIKTNNGEDKLDQRTKIGQLKKQPHIF